ncbi:MAG: hypothetical protein HFE65_04325 [Clostridiales bacterium]|nr:hypothetical protein [Clostridiales bacterium]
MTEEQAQKLEFPFTFDEIEWRVLRVSKKKPVAQVAAYVDSRAIQNRLDAVIGRENWQNSFETVTGSNNDSTAHICKLSIYYKERGEWITKSDGAGCTDVEPIKGGLSNAFKRSASMWGIGRYLYELKNIWVEIDEYKAIAQHEYSELERKYNQFLKEYLQGKGQAPQQSGQKKQTKQSAQQKPASQQQSAPVQQQSPAPTANIPNGRFANNANTVPANSQPPAPQMKSNECKIVELQVTRGAKSEQTYVVLENCQGKKLQAYIPGTPQLSNGQIISSPKIITRNHPAVGDYNVIESYNLAA